MVWNRADPQGFESSKIAHIVVPYAQGKGIDVGCGHMKCWHGMIGIDDCRDYGGQRPPAIDVISPGDDLSMFADSSLDYVFSSHLLEHFEDSKGVLEEWWRVLKPGGNMILYLPHKNFYPNIGQDGANADHKHDFLPDDIINLMKEVGSWELLENEERNKGQEYSFFQVFKKKQGKNRHVFKVWERNPEGKKRCLVIRYGAIGDAIMAASILPALKKQGYYITFNSAPNTRDILKHDPHIDEWFIQGKDYVENQALGPYWQQIQLEGRYDKIVNLCESIEGGLLTLPGRLQHEYPDETRRKLFGTVNYLERTHDIANVPYEFNARFYASSEERAWAKRERAKINAPIVCWAINGSAAHKVYPWTQIVATWLLKQTPCHIYLLADKDVGKHLQDGIVEKLKEQNIDMSKLHPMAGVWSIRETLSFIQNADCMVGPETGTLNSVGMNEKVAKVIYLSHSSKENLTKHWSNTITLEPNKKRVPCWPCHRLQYTWEHCHQVEETKAALCTSDIRPEIIFESIMKALHMKRIEPPLIPPGGTNSMAKAA